MRSTYINTEGDYKQMGFEYKEELKEMLPDYMELLEEQAKTENRGNNYWACPFCGSGNNEHHTAAFHINGTRWRQT